MSDNDLQRWLAEKLGWVLVPGVDGRTVCIPPAGHKWAGSEMIETDLPSPTDMNVAVAVFLEVRASHWYWTMHTSSINAHFETVDPVEHEHDNTPSSIATALCEACRAATEGAGDD